MVFFNHRAIDKTGRYIEFEAQCDGITEGKCILCLSDDFAEITEITLINPTLFTVEGLIRAAFNYAANRNYYIGICNAEGVEEYLEKMNFCKTEKGYSNDIPSILMGNCKNCSK